MFLDYFNVMILKIIFKFFFYFYTFIREKHFKKQP